MIKKFNKTSISILTVIAIFAIFALCLTAINIATAIEEEPMPEATVTHTTETTTEKTEAAEPLNEVQDVTLANPSNNPSITINPSIFLVPGTYSPDITINNYGDYNKLLQVTIRNVSGDIIYQDSPMATMSDRPYTFTIYHLALSTGGTYNAAVLISDTITEHDIHLEKDFKVLDFPTPTINYTIDSSISGSAVVGELNKFNVTLSNLPDHSDYGFYLKVRDPDQYVRYCYENNVTRILAPEITETFELMAHKTGLWEIKMEVYYIGNGNNVFVNSYSENFTVVSSPEPPGPGPQPEPEPTPTPGGGGTEATTKLVSDTPQTGENALIALAVINLIVLAGLAAWVLTRKRIVIIRPKH